MRHSFAVLALAGALACHGPAHPHAHGAKQVDGAIGGITRDMDSGDPINATDVHIRAHGAGSGAPALATTAATREGLFGFDHLKPGRYDLDAEVGSARTDIANIDVAVGEATVVDVELSLGTGVPVYRDHAGDPLDAAIEHFAPAHHDAATGMLEGTVNDSLTRRRVSGAVITLVLDGSPPPPKTEQTVSDDQGRFHFDGLAPGSYTVSADYSVGGRGQIEVRRADIGVAAAQGVRVPLWIDTESDSSPAP